MKFYLIGMYQNPTVDSVMAHPKDYAHFSGIGTWIDDGSKCDDCGWHGQSLSEPLLLEWEKGSDNIGDFSWEGPFGYLTVVTKKQANWLKKQKFGCRFLRVQVVEPEKVSKRARQVKFPYGGPEIFWLVCNKFVDLNKSASGVKLETSCEVCGWTAFTFKYKDIVINKNSWHGELMFRITTNRNSKATFVTEKGKELIEAKGCTNISFSPAGEIV
jgi:hypothetical protein